MCRSSNNLLHIYLFEYFCQKSFVKQITAVRLASTAANTTTNLASNPVEKKPLYVAGFTQKQDQIE